MKADRATRDAAGSILDAVRLDAGHGTDGPSLRGARGLDAALLLERHARGFLPRAALADALDRALAAARDEAPRDEGAALLSQLASGAHDRASSDALAGAARALAARFEDDGWARVADHLLQCTLALRPSPGALETGRILAQRARLARAAGALEQADDWYAMTMLHARALPSGAAREELRSRAGAGRAVLALVRGNVPRAAHRFARAVRLAERAGAADVARAAHHGCLIVAGKQGRWGDALLHGWHAFVNASGDRHLEAEALLNVGAVLAQAGRPAVALSAFQAAIEREPRPRLLLPALGGAVKAAAAGGQGALARRLAERILSLARQAALPWETTDALLAAGEAALALDDARRAALFFGRARALADRHGYHEIRFRAEGGLEAARRRRVALAAADGVAATPGTTTVATAPHGWSEEADEVCALVTRLPAGGVP